MKSNLAISLFFFTLITTTGCKKTCSDPSALNFDAETSGNDKELCCYQKVDSTSLTKLLIDDESPNVDTVIGYFRLTEVHNQLSDRMNAEKENNKDGFLVSKKVKYNQFKCAVDSTNDRLHITFKNNLDTNVILSWRLIYKTYLVMEGSDIMAPKEEKRSAASVRKSFQNSGFKADDFILEPVEIIYY